MRVLTFTGELTSSDDAYQNYSVSGRVGKIERSAEALRASHGPPSFPPVETPIQGCMGDQAEKTLGSGNSNI